MDTVLRIGVAGASGRMGRAVQASLAESAGLTLGALIGRDSMDDPAVLSGQDVVVDFTAPEASVQLARAAAAADRPALVIGSTGFAPEQDEEIARAAERVPIVKAGNFSVGVTLLVELVETAARALGPEYDIEVVEAHHRRKIDAPSGTALMLGAAAAAGREVDLTSAALRGRDGITGERPEGGIGFAVVRGGGIVGEHSVMFAAGDELLTLSHSALDRALFARGALTAARWIAGKPPGLYDMRHVLGISGRA